MQRKVTLRYWNAFQMERNVPSGWWKLLWKMGRKDLVRDILLSLLPEFLNLSLSYALHI